MSNMLGGMREIALIEDEQPVTSSANSVMFTHITAGMPLMYPFAINLNHVLVVNDIIQQVSVVLVLRQQHFSFVWQAHIRQQFINHRFQAGTVVAFVRLDKLQTKTLAVFCARRLITTLPGGAARTGT